MVDIYKLQATYFANVLIHQTNAIACVHLEDSEDFIEDGLLDSFDIVSLISMIEEKYL